MFNPCVQRGPLKSIQRFRSNVCVPQAVKSALTCGRIVTGNFYLSHLKMKYCNTDALVCSRGFLQNRSQFRTEMAKPMTQFHSPTALKRDPLGRHLPTSLKEGSKSSPPPPPSLVSTNKTLGAQRACALVRWSRQIIFAPYY